MVVVGGWHGHGIRLLIRPVGVGVLLGEGFQSHPPSQFRSRHIDINKHPKRCGRVVPDKLESIHTPDLTSKMALVAGMLPKAAALALSLTYLDAKLHLLKDLDFLLARRQIQSSWARAVSTDRTSLYYFLHSHGTGQTPSLSPTSEAIWSRERSYSWADFLDIVHRYANWFLAQGVKRGEFVALYMVNSPDFIFAWVGLWAIGAAPALINYHLTGRAFVHCLGISGAELVLVDGDEGALRRVEEVRGGFGEEVRFVELGRSRGEIYASSNARPGEEYLAGMKGNHPAALIYTSGTTGMPKGRCMMVVGLHGSVTMTGMQTPKGERPRYYICMPYYHGTGGFTAMVQLMCGNTVCVGEKFRVSGFWEDVRESRATWFVYVGETLRYLMAAPPSVMDRQHSVYGVFGNGLRPDVWDRFKERFGITQISEFFGSTEGMFMLVNRSRNNFTAHAVGHHGFLMRWMSHGNYVPVAVDAETGDITRDPKTGFAYRMPYEVGGEILVQVSGGVGEVEFPGYWNNPEANEGKFATDVFRKGDRYYRTGDMLRRDREGRWFFLDRWVGFCLVLPWLICWFADVTVSRLGDTFRWKGENVSTAEVSSVLGEYPGVLDANVYGVQVPGHDGKAGAAAIYIDPALKDTFDHQGFLR